MPIVVAVNKIDRPDAQPEKVRSELVNHGLQPEEWGGETIFVDVSAKAKQNLDELLEMLLLQSDVLELKANPHAPASGVIVESRLDVGRGAVATVLVQRGTLHVGDAVVASGRLGQGQGAERLQRQARARGRSGRCPSRSSASTSRRAPASCCASSRTSASPASPPRSARCGCAPR